MKLVFNTRTRFHRFAFYIYIYIYSENKLWYLFRNFGNVGILKRKLLYEIRANYSREIKLESFYVRIIVTYEYVNC